MQPKFIEHFQVLKLVSIFFFWDNFQGFHLEAMMTQKLDSMDRGSLI